MKLSQDLNEDYGAKVRKCGELLDRAEKAEAERDAAVKDAERYRWLRGATGSTVLIDETDDDGRCIESSYDGDSLDTVIDAMANCGESK